MSKQQIWSRLYTVECRPIVRARASPSEAPNTPTIEAHREHKVIYHLGAFHLREAQRSVVRGGAPAVPIVPTPLDHKI